MNPITNHKQVADILINLSKEPTTQILPQRQAETAPSHADLEGRIQKVEKENKQLQERQKLLIRMIQDLLRQIKQLEQQSQVKNPTLPANTPNQHLPQVIRYPNAIYRGQVKDGKPHGRGRMTLSIGTKYYGEFKEGKKHGQITVTFPNGLVCKENHQKQKNQG